MTEMRSRGHEVLVFSRHKDVTVDLLDAHGIEHEVLSTQRAGVVALASEMAKRCTKLALRLRKSPPDVLIGIMGPAIAVTALFSFMTAWNEYILAATFMGDESAYTLPVRLQHLLILLKERVFNISCWPLPL